MEQLNAYSVLKTSGQMNQLYHQLDCLNFYRHTVKCSKYIECSPHLSCIKTPDNCFICLEKDIAINSHYKTFKDAFLCLNKMEKEIQWKVK